MESMLVTFGKVAVTLAEHGAMLNELLRVGEDGSMTFETSPS
jgi:hypothetical protein